MESPKLEELLDLPPKSLRALAEAFADGPLRSSLSAGLLAPFVGGKADRAAAVLKSLRDWGCSPLVLSELCEVLHKAKARMTDSERNLFLVLSGPDVPGIPVVDTATVARSLFVEARKEVLRVQEDLLLLRADVHRWECSSREAQREALQWQQQAKDEEERVQDLQRAVDS